MVGHRRHVRTRRGIALMDAILGGMMLGIGLAVLLSVTQRSLAMQSQGQRLLVASWIVDELLAMVLVEGPVAYPQMYATHGRYESPPFDDFEFDVDIQDIGLGKPLLVTATVRWPRGRGYQQVQAQTYIAQRLGDPIQVRAPFEPIDRLSRYYDDE